MYKGFAFLSISAQFDVDRNLIHFVSVDSLYCINTDVDLL